MRESFIENKFYQYAKKRGVLAMKFTSPNRRSVPDRIVLCPGGKMFFIEFKAPGKKPTDGQKREHERLRGLGFRVEVCDNVGQAEAILDEIYPT